MSRRLIATIIFVLLGGSAAVGQATRPAPVEWVTAVSAFSAAIGAGDETAARLLLAGDAEIRSFTPGQDVSVKRLIDFATAGTLLGAHGYVYPSSNIAQDLAGDVAASDVVPADAKRAMAADTDNSDKAAQTAIKWIGVSLNADEGALVGMIVLWNSRAGSDGAAHPVFILVKGGRNDAGQVVIRKVVYGDPLN